MLFRSAGASVCLMFAVPFSIAARIAAGDGNASGTRAAIAVVLSFGAAVGFFIGAGVAARHQSVGMPLVHGIITAGVAYLVPQAIFVVVKMARGGDVRWGGVVFNLTVAVVMGVFGGLAGSAIRRTEG